VLISVSDTGPGFPSDFTEIFLTDFEAKIIDFNLQQSLNRIIKSKGIGFGLTISNILVQKLNDTQIQVSSKQNTGSTFSFILSNK